MLLPALKEHAVLASGVSVLAATVIIWVLMWWCALLISWILTLLKCYFGQDSCCNRTPCGSGECITYSQNQEPLLQTGSGKQELLGARFLRRKIMMKFKLRYGLAVALCLAESVPSD